MAHGGGGLQRHKKEKFIYCFPLKSVCWSCDISVCVFKHCINMDSTQTVVFWDVTILIFVEVYQISGRIGCRFFLSYVSQRNVSHFLYCSQKQF